MEKDGNLRIPCFISNKVPLRCRKNNPIKMSAKVDMVMSRSTKVISTPSNCNSVVELGDYDCPLVTMNRKSGGGPCFSCFLGCNLFGLFEVGFSDGAG